MAESLAAALAELQANPPRIRKRAQAQYGKYANLPDVHKILMPVLSALGLLWETDTGYSADDWGVHYKLSHLKSGEFKAGFWPVETRDPQKQGSAVTYARRYALVTVTGVTPEGDDDDGQAASRQRTPAKIPGPDHERLQPRAMPGDRPAERIKPGDNPVDDLWIDQEPGQLPATQQLPEERPGTIDGKQRSKIMAKVGRMTSDDRAALLSQAIGREVDSTNDLSWVEADRLGKAIQRGEWP